MSDHKKSLQAYLKGESGLSIYGIVEVLRNCSLAEFDRIVEELRPVHSQYVSWLEIEEIRDQLKVRSWR